MERQNHNDIAVGAQNFVFEWDEEARRMRMMKEETLENGKQKHHGVKLALDWLDGLGWASLYEDLLFKRVNDTGTMNLFSFR